MPKQQRAVSAKEIEAVWSSCKGSAKGQYRLGHREVGVLLEIIHDLRDYVEPHPSWETEKRFYKAEAAVRRSRE